MIVVDASVVFKWLADEDPVSTAKAREILAEVLEGTDEASAPDILLYEIANILTFKTKLELKDVEDTWKRFIRYPIKFSYPDADFLRKCLIFSKENGVTIYDSSYIILAEEKGSDFITSDQKLVKKVKLPFVKSLAGYEAPRPRYRDIF